MAHKTLINGTAYDIVGGSTLITGTDYDIVGGKTLTSGVGYDVNIGTTSSGFTWPGLSSATWADINDLCVAKQNGDISEWPSDVFVGATPTATVEFPVEVLPFRSPEFHSANDGYYLYYNVIIRALDELPGTITFQMLLPPADGMTSYQDKMPYLNPDANNAYQWGTSRIRNKLLDLYNDGNGNIKNYMVPVIKRTSLDYNVSTNVDSQTEDTTDYFFLPAWKELSQYANTQYKGSALEGTVYNGVVKQNIYTTPIISAPSWSNADFAWTRSRWTTNTSGRILYTYTDGTIYVGRLDVSSSTYVSPFFIIGNPNVAS